jgi:hypothetical protein
MVMPIWEGSGNIIVLDMMRPRSKSKGFDILCEKISASAGKNKQHGDWIKKNWKLLQPFLKGLLLFLKMKWRLRLSLFLRN